MERESLGIKVRAVEPFFKNAYLLVCNATGRAAYVDPGDESSELMGWIAEKGLDLSHILLTHGHMDHICGVAQVKQRWDVPVCLHQEDEFLYRALQEQGQWFGLRYAPAPPVDHYLYSGQTLSLGDVCITVHHTPGHSPGSVTLEVGTHLFCGDLIFAGSVGRTDLPGGSHELLLDTIRQKILPLGEERILHPGHGVETTIGRELQTNPFLGGGLREKAGT